MIEYLRRFDVSKPDIDQEVIVLCKDGSCHVAIYRGLNDWTARHCWDVLGPAGAHRRLQKRVEWWMPRPQLPDVEEADG